MAEGIQSSGTNVIDIGAVTTPMSYFAAHELNTQCSVVVTGSHNPPDYNGLKMVIAGDTLAGDDIQALKALGVKELFTPGTSTQDIIRFVRENIRATV